MFTTLLTSKARPKYNYTHQLLNFMETNKPEEDEKPHIIIAELLKAVVSQLSTTFKIKCGKKLENQSFLDYSAFEVAEYMQDESDSCENEIKFLCELVKKNVNSLGSLEGYVFDTVTHLDVGNEAPGLRTCVFLCKVL